MIQQLFTIFDSAAGAANRVFQAPTIEMAIRTFRREIEQGESPFSQFPEDYTLFHVGSFNMETMEVVPIVPPHSLGVAITFLPQGPVIQEEFDPEAANA